MEQLSLTFKKSSKKLLKHVPKKRLTLERRKKDFHVVLIHAYIQVYIQSLSIHVCVEIAASQKQHHIIIIIDIQQQLCLHVKNLSSGAFPISSKAWDCIILRQAASFIVESGFNYELCTVLKLVLESN